MGIQSIKCALPCCTRTAEEQTKCSLIIRITTASLGGILALVSILILSGIPGLHSLGTVEGGLLAGMGGLVLLGSAGLKCIAKKSFDPPSGTSKLPSHKKAFPHKKPEGEQEKELAAQGVEAEKLETGKKKDEAKFKAEKKVINMSYNLHSHTDEEAICSQYSINTNAPVQLTLSGPRSYCLLTAIQDPTLKETLSKVGIQHERTRNNTFFNFSHTFTPTEKNESLKDNDTHVVDIFEIVNSAVNAQTNGKLVLDLSDITALVVKKGEDRSFTPAHCAYELSIKMSEQAVETAKKSGLTFNEFISSCPKGTEMWVMRAGQKGIKF